MADKQISQLTEVSTPSTTDLYVCQQSSTAKKISLSAIKEFILKIANLSSVASSLSNSDYFLVQPSSGDPKKVTASTMKSFFGNGSGSGGSGFDDNTIPSLPLTSSISGTDYFAVQNGNTAKKVTASTMSSYFGGSSSGGDNFIAIYDVTPITDIESALDAGKTVWMKAQNNTTNYNIFPLWRYYESGATKEAEFYNFVAGLRYKCDTSGWSTP